MLQIHTEFNLLQQLDNSTNVSVVLGPMTLSSSGTYRCEVSGEAPLFQTVSDHGDMVVVGMYRVLIN